MKSHTRKCLQFCLVTACSTSTEDRLALAILGLASLQSRAFKQTCFLMLAILYFEPKKLFESKGKNKLGLALLECRNFQKLLLHTHISFGLQCDCTSNYIVIPTSPRYYTNRVPAVLTLA